MTIETIRQIKELKNLDLLAKQVVEGFITGMHKSPFHGFSVEFAEHRLYNKGESTRYIDWKLYARSEKLYVKRFEEETNLRCHLIIDNSASMHFPQESESLSKIEFSVYGAASLMEILKKQRDAVGLSIYSDQYEYYAGEKGSDRHRMMLLNQLEELLKSKKAKGTETFKFLHQIAENIHRRSMIFLFTDMFQANTDQEQLFEALRHLKYNKHEVVMFHTYDGKLEKDFDFDHRPKKFIDVETGDEIQLYADQVKENYKKEMESYFEDLKFKCLQYKIDYVPVDVRKGFEPILLAYLISRKKFV